MEKIKTIRISEDTHNRFIKLGSYSDSAESILKKLLRYWENGEH